MKIQYASDLHLEFPENESFLQAHPIIPKGDVLILAGDIAPFYMLDDRKEFFDYVADNFETTYWIPGNHEYYHFDLASKSGIINEKIRDNVFLVNNLSIQHSNLKLIFSTLWSKISSMNQWMIEKRINDFRLIKFNNSSLTAEQFNQLHLESINFIEQELKQDTSDKRIVVTHHVPTFKNYPAKYKSSSLNEAFGTELFNLIESDGPDYWIYGHHHANTKDFKIGKTKMLTNQLGYVQLEEHHLFNPGKSVTLNL